MTSWLAQVGGVIPNCTSSAPEGNILRLCVELLERKNEKIKTSVKKKKRKKSIVTSVRILTVIIVAKLQNNVVTMGGTSTYGCSIYLLGQRYKSIVVSRFKRSTVSPATGLHP